MAVTNADVARLAGTSTAVVSYVFNDGPRRVASKTRERVLVAAAELGYRPNRLARGLRAEHTGFVGLLSPDSTNPYFSALDRALVIEMGRRKLTPLISHAGLLGLSEAEALNTFLGARVDGMVVVWLDENDTELPEVDVPIVFVHHRPLNAQGSFIPADNVQATRLAISHFAEHGISRPAFWGGLDDQGPTGERQREWRRATGRHDAEPIRSAYSRSAAFDEFLRLHASGELPSAVLISTGVQALGVLAAAHHTGTRIPENLSIILLDGSDDMAFSVPSLTAVNQPVEAMAHAAVNVLCGEDAGVLEPGTLVIRESCGCTRPITP